ncbi:MAG TPA: DUF4157 domain-containing protein, partial [Pyrinomonadaceae bacterium]|nr:DUF4157 domain-containing protein [Pyrinomonadaceae bacterium]
GECNSKKHLQTKLAIGASNDPLEREADQVADRILAAPANPLVTAALPHIQRSTGQSSTPTALAPASVDRVLANPGMPLGSELREEMSQRFGHDFSRVRVHTGSSAEQSANDVNAHAYTVGHNIVFNAGRFAPGTNEGRRLIAHELTHVVQQSDSDEPEVGRGNNKRGMTPISHRDNTNHVQRFVPCEQANTSLQSCPPRAEREVAESKDDPMTLHGVSWLSENGYSINGYLIVGFEVGKSAIKKNLKDLLKWKELVAWMSRSNVQWKIHGISDCSGSKDQNEGIRRERAEAVYNQLPEDARKHVVSRESLPLYECITGNQNRVDRTVNRSVLIEQAGRKVDIDPAEEEVREANLPKFVCGPNVTRQVAEAVRLAKSIFRGWNRSQKEDACDALVSYEGASGKVTSRKATVVAECSWDIYELHRNKWISDKFQPTCATTGRETKKCGESIQMDDDCHHAGAVNYVIFGTMFRLCSDEDLDMFFDFTKSNMKTLIDMYKGSRMSGFGTPVENFEGSLAWAKVGYEGWPGVSSPAGDWNACAPMCPKPYSDQPFDIHWHPHRSKYNCP